MAVAAVSGSAWGKGGGTSAPAVAPVASGSALYNVTGGLATTLQEALDQSARWNPAYAQQGYARPRAGANVYDFSGGATSGAVGTLTARAPADTNYMTRRARVALVTGASANNTAALNFYGTGAVPLLNRTQGFQVSQAAGIGVISANARWFVGMYNQLLTILPEPSALLNALGIGADAADTNVQLMTNDNAGVATKTDLGASFPARTVGAVYDLWVGCEPSTTGVISVRVRRLDVAAVAYAQLSSNLPVLAQLLFPLHAINTGIDSTALALESMGFESTAQK